MLQEAFQDVWQGTLNVLQTFREALHGCFPQRGDAIINLVDGISGNTSARSPVEISLDPLFARAYSSVYDAQDHIFSATTPESASQERIQHQQGFIRLIEKTLPLPEQRPFRLFVVDGTPVPRPFAKTLKDRGTVHSPKTHPDAPPIALGHEASLLAVLLEKAAHAPPWIVPLSLLRVPTHEKATDIAAQQVKAIMTDNALPFGKELSVLVGDTAYSAMTFLTAMRAYENLVTIARVRSDRVFYRMPPPPESSPGRGRPRSYGERFALSDRDTWGDPDEVATTTQTTQKGRELVIEIEAWFDLLMRGKKGCPMHKHPFTLIRVTVKDKEGNLVFKRPMWLIVTGKRRKEISLVDARGAYAQRFDIEHFFRFGKTRLLMTAAQTPEVEREENWWELVGLAYTQLWLASPLASAMPHPWERYAVPKDPSRPATPSAVQRDFGRIIRQVGTPAAPPKPRGKSPGRQKGWSPGRRKPCPVVKKGSKTPTPKPP